ESDLPTGSFKPRGALNALLTTAAKRPVSGVVAASTGNHGAAVAYAARIAKVDATIFLQENRGVNFCDARGVSNSGAVVTGARGNNSWHRALRRSCEQSVQRSTWLERAGR